MWIDVEDLFGWIHVKFEPQRLGRIIPATFLFKENKQSFLLFKAEILKFGWWKMMCMT